MLNKTDMYIGTWDSLSLVLITLTCFLIEKLHLYPLLYWHLLFFKKLHTPEIFVNVLGHVDHIRSKCGPKELGVILKSRLI